jgi:HlyD family secretion protein
MTEKAKRPASSRIVILLILVVLGLAYGRYRYNLAVQPYEWSGTVEARTIGVGSRAGGRVKEILVREGDHVTAGQPIMTLETGDWLAQLLEAQGQLDQQQATLERLENGSRPEEIDEAHARALSAAAALAETEAGARREQIAAARARLAAQEIAVEKAQLDAARIHRAEAIGKGIISQLDVDAADTGLRGAIATRDSLREALDELVNGSRREDVDQARAHSLEMAASEKLMKLGPRAEDKAVARGQVKVAQGKVDQIKVMIDELTIRAPRAARIEACDLRPGDLLAPNATAATLLEDDQLYVRIYVPETLIGHLKVGDTVPISVDSFPGESFDGVVEHMNEVGEYSPRNLQTADERADQVFGTRVGIRSGEGKLRAGMAAFIRVPKVPK